MTLTQFLGLASITALAACGGGGGGKGGGTTAEPVTAEHEPSPKELRAACGIYTTADWQEEFGHLPEDQLGDDAMEKGSWDPMTQTPKDVDACLQFVRWALDDLQETNNNVAASDIAYGLCNGETSSGEACYHKAYYEQLHHWAGDESGYAADEAQAYLGQACEQGHQPACAILETGVDSEGRTWFEVEASEDGE